jgi:glyoxylase-like metal-dependent hydrolase (beta-lactamase superfamily II)
MERAVDMQPANGNSGGLAVNDVVFPFPDYPAPGNSIEVADGIHWVSTPVPFVGLKQVNLWLLDDGDGWTMIDCGYGRRDVRDLIEAAWRELLGGRPVTRLIVTHNHPDHIGNAQWICERWGGLRPQLSQPEWYLANLAALDRDSDNMAQRAAFYRRHGLDETTVAKFLAEVVPYKDGVQLPRSYRRLRDADMVTIGADRWRVITGEGHSPEHVSLYCAERRILIAGDQILPAITTNVSTWPNEPEFDAVGAFLGTCRRFLELLDGGTLILPSHRKPFYNVHYRLRELARHHAIRLNLILDNAPPVTRAGELIDVLFKPGLDGHQIGFAMGEAIAHLNHLVTLGHLRLVENRDDIHYQRLGGVDRRVQPAF